MLPGMDTQPFNPPPLDAAGLTQVARSALQSTTVEVQRWHARPAGASSGSATAGVYHVTGTARDHGSSLDWSVVLKIIRPAANAANPASLDEGHALYWKREALAYTSGLLDDLPGGIAAPRCLLHEEREDGSIWLWLEEVQDRYGSAWPLEQYARAARCLGRFNGVYLAGRPLPNTPWLGQPGALRGLLDAFAWLQDTLRDPATWEHPLIATAFPPGSARRLLALWHNRTALIDMLDRLPLTLCHKDAFRKNMFAPVDRSAEQLVMIDWAYVGHGEVGLDLADLFGASHVTFSVDTTDLHAFDATVFGSYLAGLRDAGWYGDEQMVRFSFAASAALKYGGLLFWLHELAAGRDTSGWEGVYDRPIETIIHEHTALVMYLLDLADEAHALGPRL
jgi:hypothetical protein